MKRQAQQEPTKQMYKILTKNLWPQKHAIAKLLLIMRLTTIILITAILQVSAASYGQKITLSEKSAQLVKVFDQISVQSGFDFLVSSSILKESKPVRIQVKNMELSEVLDKLFEGRDLKYSIENKSVVVSKKETGFVDNILKRFLPINVRGRVVDSDGKPLVGASVSVKGGSGTTTDKNGNFFLINVDEKDILAISFVGYLTKEVKASADLHITLDLIISNLRETVIKGYYNTTKELNTGSVGSLKAVDISKQPINDPLLALEGRISGLYISQTTGVPGSAIKVQLRGQNSIANGNDPLYIIDGLPFNPQSLSQLGNAAGFAALSPFTSIRPDDIESIDILKDADATAIYGSRGANGVILITTKKGKTGTTKMDVNLYRGVSKATKFLDLMNTEQYLEMKREAFKNDNSSFRPTDYDLNGTWDQNRYTDWQKLFVGNSSDVTDLNANLSGGNELTQFLVGLGYRKETTVFPGDFSNRIGSFNVNLNHRSENNRLNVSLTLSYTNNNNRLPTVDFSQLIYMAPNAPAIYDERGQLNWENNTFQNPFAALQQKSNSINDNLISNLTASYNITSDLKLKSSFGYGLSKMNEVNIIPFTSFIPSSFNPELLRSNTTAYNGVNSWIIEPQLNYYKAFNNHHLELLVGTSFQENKLNSLIQNASGFSSDALLENSGSGTKITSSVNYTQYRYNALYARIGYDYKNKYVLNFTGRRDGSSRFGASKQFGDFGSIGAAWLFSKEQWLNNLIPFLSLGKLRGSIGKTGNDQLIDYQYLSTYSNINGYYGTSGLIPTQLNNPFYSWETINKIETALELVFFENRLSLTTSFYRNRTGNQLVGYSLPLTTGFSLITANLPAVIENSGFEFDISTLNVKNKNFSWSSSFNISIPKNKLLSYPDIENSPYATRYAIGKSLSVNYLYHSTGVNPQTGIYSFDDLNGDSEISGDKDRTPVFLGQKFFGGLSNNFAYNGFSLDIFLHFVKQNGFGLTRDIAPGYSIRTGANQPTIAMDRWQKLGDDSMYQKYTTFRNEGAVNAHERFIGSDANIVDASFIRLKNVMLSWNLPNRWTDKWGIKNIRVYFQGQNLLTLTNFKRSDAETRSLTTLPPLRILTTGLQGTF